MVSDLLIREQSLLENPTARVAVCLVLDTSISMGPRSVYPDWVVAQGIRADEGWVTIPDHLAHHGQPDPHWSPPIDELNMGLQEFYRALDEDEIARWSAEIAIITFGGQARLVSDFAPLEHQQAPTLTVEGETPMGAAIEMALDALENRKREYSNAGVDYYQPWLVLMTDGAPTDTITQAARRSSQMVNAGKLVVFPIGIGQDADMNTLGHFSPKRPPLRLKGLRFREFFLWLSQSVSRTSQSIPGETVKLDTDGIAGWGEL